jgi:NADH:ubiquinone oxidoreductase subunit K
MNWPIFIAGVGAGFITLGHFAVGSKQYLKPMLQASFDEVPKKINHCVFHYISVYLVLSTIFLLLTGIGYISPADNSWLVKFISINYGFFAVVQIVIAATSGIQNAIFKMFQWMLFAFVAAFAWVGVAYSG